MSGISADDIHKPLPTLSKELWVIFAKHHFPPSKEVVWSFIYYPEIMRTKTELEILIRKWHDINADSSILTYINSYNSIFDELRLPMQKYDIKRNQKMLDVIQ